MIKYQLIEISTENSSVKSSNNELDSKNRKLQEFVQKNNIGDVDDLVITTKTKSKEGFYESKATQNSNSKNVVNPANDINIPSSNSKNNLTENSNLKDNGNSFFNF